MPTDLNGARVRTWPCCEHCDEAACGAPHTEPCGEVGCQPDAYSDPDFTPGMVVAAADRDSDDMRTWLVDGDCFWRRWTSRNGPITEIRSDLPERLVVVGDDGRATP